MSISLLLWIGLDFFIRCFIALFFAVIGGLGLAAGFELFKYLKSWRKDKSNKAYIEGVVDEYLTKETS